MSENITRVLHLDAGLGNDSIGIVGGVPVVLMNLYRHIDRALVQFDFISPNMTSYDFFKDEIEQSGGRIFELHINGNILTRKIKLYTRLRKFLKQNPYKIIHVNTGSFFIQLVGLFAAKREKVPIRIAHSHNAGKDDRKKWLLMAQNLMKPLLPHVATHFFSCSDLATEWMFDKKTIQSGQVSVINNGIEIQRYLFNETTRKEHRDTLGLKDKFVVGHVGRFVDQKNHMFLIDIFNCIHKKEPNSMLLLIGEGPLMGIVREKVSMLNLDDCVRFLGMRNDVDKLYQAMDVFLLPSLYEGLGIVAIEAQAAGIKIIAADTVPTEAKITDQFEYMPLKRSASEWAKKVLKYQNNYIRCNTYDEIVNAGFDIQEAAKSLGQFYLQQTKDMKHENV